MIIDPPAAAGDLRSPTARWPRRRAEALLQRFHAAFPDIAYDLGWASDTLNAQAFLLGEQRRVRLYGGLARHRRIGLAGLACVLAHETGHHLGGAPHHPIYFWLSSEERADEWATAEGLARVFGPRRAPLLGERGRAQLRLLWPARD